MGIRKKGECHIMRESIHTLAINSKYLIGNRMKRLNNYFFGTEEFHFDMLLFYLPIVITMFLPIMLAYL